MCEPANTRSNEGSTHNVGWKVLIVRNSTGRDKDCDAHGRERQNGNQSLDARRPSIARHNFAISILSQHHCITTVYSKVIQQIQRKENHSTKRRTCMSAWKGSTTVAFVVAGTLVVVFVWLTQVIKYRTQVTDVVFDKPRDQSRETNTHKIDTDSRMRLSQECSRRC